MASLNHSGSALVKCAVSLARMAVGVVFLTASVESAANVRPAVAGIMYLLGTERMPGPVTIATLVLFIEGAVGVCLITDWPRRIAPMAGVVLLALFTAYIVALAKSPLSGQCGCGTLMSMIRGATADMNRIIGMNAGLAILLVVLAFYKGGAAASSAMDCQEARS
ncbi:MAG: hypothetical protein HRU76_15885 [Phycisphaeraceae bacterium]|nr:MAG: hypothetical protein HRU76_15885 [Phycisphaeraceae bacterium]